jgi:hypothetical protein
MVFGSKKKRPPLKPVVLEQDLIEEVPPSESVKPGGLVDYDWDLNEKVQKLNSFKRLGPDQFKKYIDDNRENVMLWPIDVRRELARKIDKVLPEIDPDIKGFDIDDYITDAGNT